MLAVTPLKLVQPKPSLHESLVETLLDVTRSSTHSYEQAVHRLLLDVIDQYARGALNDSSYYAIIGTGVDVLFFFNYDPELLAGEANSWYRASIIHQIGQGMLQAIERVRPDMTAKNFFREAMQSLALGIPVTHPAKTSGALHCKQWGTKAN